MTTPSLFNDVLGPVMRGPSSSHSAAALRIGRLARDLVGGQPDRVTVDYDPSGSLVTTHESQGSDLGLIGGLLGWEAHDERLVDYEAEAAAAGLEVEIRYLEYGANHPNMYRLRIERGDEVRELTAVSTGGGMIEVWDVDGVPVRSTGDLVETFVWFDGDVVELGDLEGVSEAACHEHGESGVWHLRSREPVDLGSVASTAEFRVLRPVLPVLAPDGASLPFDDASGLLRRLHEAPAPLWRLAIEYEVARSGWTEDDVVEAARSTVATMRGSVDRGLEGRVPDRRILPTQVSRFVEAERANSLLGGSIQNRMIRYVTAIMETKSALGTIVAAPTAGSCAAMPAALLAVADEIEADETTVAHALLAAGLIGLCITKGATFSAEIGGCMAECGSASSMAAAGLAEMMGGPPDRALSAASVALQNMFGLTCDPIANRVEAPCLGKNTMAASNAFNSANMAIAGYEHVIPFDEVVAAMNEVAHAMPRELCCTGLGGLSTTPTSKAIQARLDGKPGC